MPEMGKRELVRREMSTDQINAQDEGTEMIGRSYQNKNKTPNQPKHVFCSEKITEAPHLPVGSHLVP